MALPAVSPHCFWGPVVRARRTTVPGWGAAVLGEQRHVRMTRLYRDSSWDPESTAAVLSVSFLHKGIMTPSDLLPPPRPPSPLTAHLSVESFVNVFWLLSFWKEYFEKREKKTCSYHSRPPGAHTLGLVKSICVKVSFFHTD